MPQQGIKIFEVERRDVFMLRDILPGPAWAPYSSGIPSRAREAEPSEEECEKDGNSLKGLLVALGLEALLAEGVYEVWRVWHILH